MSTRFYHVCAIALIWVTAQLGGVACSSLTEPIGPEPVSTESTPSATAAATAAPARSAPPQPAAAPQPVPTVPSAPAPDEKMTKTTLRRGAGAVAKVGDRVRVHYVGTFTDGSQIDSAHDRNKPFDFVVGQGQVIKGWDQGIPGMKVGEKRKLVIPPSLAYGAGGRAGIPPNATLIFDIDLLAVNPPDSPAGGQRGAPLRSHDARMTPDLLQRWLRPASNAGRRDQADAPRAGAFPLSAPLAYSGALLSGLMYWLAFGGMDVWPLAFVAWVPLILGMHRQTVRRATLLGWLAGLTMNVAGFFWLQKMLETFSGFPGPVCFLFLLVVCAYQGARVGLLGWLYGRAASRGWPSYVVFAGAYVASELCYPLLFPWYFAATVHQVPVLTQVADLGGPIAVGLVLVAANIGVAEPVLARAERRKISSRTLAVGAGVLIAACAYGAWRIRAVDAETRAAPEATVGVVQANMGLTEKRSQFEEGLTRHLSESKELEQDHHADFVVWSETSAMRPVREESYRQELRSGVARRIGAPAIFGAVIFQRVADARGYILFNTAVSSDADGTIRSRYDKQYLLTFGEYLPFGETFPILYSWSPNSGHFSRGTSLEPLVVNVRGTPRSVSMLICYEDVLPGFTNDAVRHANPELLVNMTNDAWFGDTVEPWQHLALAQFRAIEHRRYLVRGTNSGVSAVVDPVGRVVVHSGTFSEEAISATIHWLRARTLYELLGDWPWVLVSLLAFAGAFWRRPSPEAHAS